MYISFPLSMLKLSFSSSSPFATFLLVSLAQFMFHQFDLLKSYLFIIYSFIHFFFSGCQQYLRATLQDSSILVPYSFSISLFLSLESCKIIIIIIVSYFQLFGIYCAQNDRYCYWNDVFLLCGARIIKLAIISNSYML